MNPGGITAFTTPCPSLNNTDPDSGSNTGVT
jgi:hypothetical protein